MVDLWCHVYMDVSENGGTPKSSNLIGFSIINHPFWGTSIFGNTHMVFIKKIDIWVQWFQWFLLSVEALFQQKCRCGFLKFP